MCISECIFSAYITEVTDKMRCWKDISRRQGKAEEIAVLAGPRTRRKHGKKSNPYSTSGLDKFQSVCDELSTKRQYFANKVGVPEAMVRFVSSKKGWIPVAMGTRGFDPDGDTAGVSILVPAVNNNSDGDTAGVSILVPAVSNNSETGRELRENDERNNNIGGSKRKGLTVSASTSSVKAHDDSTDFCGTVSLAAVNSQKNNPEHSQNRHNPEAKRLRRSVSMNNWPTTRPVSPVMGSDNFYRKTRPAAAAQDASMAALTVMFVTLFCFVFYGRFCAILFTSTWLYLVPAMFRL